MQVRIISGKGLKKDGVYYPPGAVFTTDDRHGRYLTTKYPHEYVEAKDAPKPTPKSGGGE
jgi:hypothetical protein